MSLLNRKPRPLSREVMRFRDDRIFFVATEDRYAAPQYLTSLRESRVHIVPIPTPEASGASAGQVVQRLTAAIDVVKKRAELLPEDQYWIVIDTDHQISGSHISSYVAALNEARSLGYRVAVSNPCFELWLLLHHEDVAKGTVFPNATLVAQRLRSCLGTYEKTKIRIEQFERGLIPKAIARARALEEDPDNPKGYWPEKAGTRMYQLVEEIFKASDVLRWSAPKSSQSGNAM